MLKHWAITLGDWVEIRTHPTMPRAIRSKGMCPIKVYSYFTHRYRTVNKLLESVIFTGGKVVKVFKRRSFYAKTGLKIPNNTVQQILPEQIDRLFRKERSSGSK